MSAEAADTVTASVRVNQSVVARVVDRLDATGLLGAGADPGPEDSCREATKFRDLLNMEIPNLAGAGAGDLVGSFKLMRRSARDFVRAGGPGAITFQSDPAHYEACLAAMRQTLGEGVDALRTEFGISARA